MEEIIEIKISVQGTNAVANEIKKHLQNIATNVSPKNIATLGKASLKKDVNKKIEQYSMFL